MELLTILQQVPHWQLILISVLHWVAWGYCNKLKGFCIDDQEGVAKFSDRFIIYKDPAGNVVKEELVDSYPHVLNQTKTVQIKHTAWNPYLGFPDNVMRWTRLMWGRSFQVLGKNSKGHEQFGWVQDARRHHLLN